jgi:hypothetical protein
MYEDMWVFHDHFDKYGIRYGETAGMPEKQEPTNA